MNKTPDENAEHVNDPREHVAAKPLVVHQCEKESDSNDSSDTSDSSESSDSSAEVLCERSITFASEESFVKNHVHDQKSSRSAVFVSSDEAAVLQAVDDFFSETSEESKEEPVAPKMGFFQRFGIPIFHRKAKSEIDTKSPQKQPENSEPKQ